QTFQIGPIRLGGKNVVRAIDRPHITFGSICGWRTIRRAQVSGGINDAFAIRSEITARRTAFPRADQLYVRSIAIHGEDLIAFVHLLASNVTFTFMSWPARLTTTATMSPGFVARSAYVKS